MIKWLLIDIGDVLLLKDRTQSFTELLAEELGVNISLAQEINRLHYTTMEAKYVSESEFIQHLDEDLGYEAPSNIYSLFAKAYKNQIHPNVELLDFLKQVRSSGVKTAVLSNTIAIYQEAQEEAGISEADGFDPVLYSWKVEMVKPNRGIFDLAIEELGVRPEEIVFIDDKEGHLSGARSSGLRTILFDGTDSVIEQIHRVLFG